MYILLRRAGTVDIVVDPDPQHWIRVAPDAELAGYPAAGYLANLFCRISGIRPDIRLNS